VVPNSPLPPTHNLVHVWLALQPTALLPAVHRQGLMCMHVAVPSAAHPPAPRAPPPSNPTCAHNPRLHITRQAVEQRRQVLPTFCLGPSPCLQPPQKLQRLAPWSVSRGTDQECKNVPSSPVEGPRRYALENNTIATATAAAALTTAWRPEPPGSTQEAWPQAKPVAAAPTI
jgi:hypothetical protein